MSNTYVFATINVLGKPPKKTTQFPIQNLQKSDEFNRGYF